ncbi:OmpA family protein [Immundisolibacter sp.]|uniref:OmpA family protein n=1 Tax=Immundisolibacter sp. TaxID=1934948 RepID=UPI0019931640|nr:OmpA family protein [Immundisolibacter sp.]MBC7160975.1 OmpA family protein [Immundisolibacter sp.]MEA3219417.1 Outer membrane porin F [Immundisolibacter sp.]
MTNKKQLLVAAGLAALSSGVLAETLDDRVYLNLGLSYTLPDNDRDGSSVEVENAPGGFIGVGKAINEWLNLELNLKGQHADLDGASGSWKHYGATVDGLFFFNRSPAFAPYAVVGAGALRSDISNAKNSTSPVIEAGLGFMHDVDDDGAKLRLEARHRWDFADLNRQPGSDDKTFNDWILMAGVTIPIGARPQSAPEPRPVVTMAEPTPPPAPAPAPVTETVVLKGVNFCFDCDTLSGEAQAILDSDAMAIVKHHPNASFEVAGHTDAVGSDAYNLALSQRRASNVRAYLVQQGVEPSRMTAVGYGESQPVADNSTEAGRAENRRVELRITEMR